NMGSTPLRARAVEDALRDVDIAPANGPDPLRDACAAANEGTSPPADLHAQPDYRRHLPRVLTRRAVLAAARARTSARAPRSAAAARAGAARRRSREPYEQGEQGARRMAMRFEHEFTVPVPVERAWTT